MPFLVYEPLNDSLCSCFFNLRKATACKEINGERKFYSLTITTALRSLTAN